MAPARADLTLNAPSTVHPPLTVWDVAFDSAGPADPGRRRVEEVSARFTAPRGAAPREVTIDLAAPGVVTPLTRLSVPALRPGSDLVVRWRWAAPLRAQPPPYDHALVATARYLAGRRRETVRAERSVRVPAPAPPHDDVYVSDLPFAWATNGYGPVERDRASGEQNGGDGGPLLLDGTEYRKGLGVNALALTGFHLGGQCRQFTAVVGIDDSRGDSGSVVFRVVADDEVLYDSGPVRGRTPAATVRVDVTGVQRLDLVTEPTPDGQAGDGADWADARLTFAGRGAGRST